jgi:hypothetical protein
MSSFSFDDASNLTASMDLDFAENEWMQVSAVLVLVHHV